MLFKGFRKKIAGAFANKYDLGKTYRSVVDSSKKALYKITDEDSVLSKSLDSGDFSKESKQQNLRLMNWGFSGLGFHELADMYVNTNISEYLWDHVYSYLPEVVNQYASFHGLQDIYTTALNVNDGSATHTLAVTGLTLAGLSAVYLQSKRSKNKDVNVGKISQENKINVDDFVDVMVEDKIPTSINILGALAGVGSYIAGLVGSAAATGTMQAVADGDDRVQTNMVGMGGGVATHDAARTYAENDVPFVDVMSSIAANGTNASSNIAGDAIAYNPSPDDFMTNSFMKQFVNRS